MDSTDKSIEKFIKQHLKETRLRHTYGVRETAIHLAEKYGADVDKAARAALYHDAYRFLEGEEMNNVIRSLGLNEKYLDNPSLAHSKIAAEMIKHDFGETDEDIINAVCYHTTGRAGMSLLEKIVYLADAIEPGRCYPAAESLRKLAEEDIDAACLASMKNTAEFVEQNGGFLDSETISAIEDIRAKSGTLPK